MSTSSSTSSATSGESGSDYKSHVTPWELDRYLGSLYMTPSNRLLVFPDPPPPLLAQTLDLAGHPWKAVGNVSIATQAEPTDGWSRRGRVRRRRPRGRVRHLPRAAQARQLARAGAAARHRRAARRARAARRPLRRLLPHAVPPEGARGAAAAPVLADAVAAARPEIVEYGDLVLNLETYQAALAGAPARPHVHGVRAAEVLRHPPGQGVHPRAAAVAGVGLRVLRRRAHRRRPRAAAAGEARRGAREPDPDRALGRLPLRHPALGARPPSAAAAR